MRLRRLVLAIALACAPLILRANAPLALADTPIEGTGPYTVSFSPVVERVADGNTFIDYTFTQTSTGIVEGTRTGFGESVIHADGTFNTQNSGIFTGTIAGRYGSVKMDFRGSGSFASAGGIETFENGTGGLAGVHGTGTAAASANSPTSFVGVISYKVSFSSP